MQILFENVELIIFDFDGVLTNNLVYLNQNGDEWVSCSRADGLAFDVLQKLKKSVCILSTEQNPVVAARANKLKVPVLQGISDKTQALKSLADKERIDLANVVYVGNDINDYNIMQLCGYAICPSDSHSKVKEISDVVLKTPGGKGVAREILEDVFKLDFIKILYDKG